MVWHVEFEEEWRPREWHGCRGWKVAKGANQVSQHGPRKKERRCHCLEEKNKELKKQKGELVIEREGEGEKTRSLPPL